MKQLSTKDLETAFGVSQMTINNWRRGSPTRTPLPFNTKGRAVSFAPMKVERWAATNGIGFVVALAKLQPQERGTPGPKPKAEVETS